MAILPLIILPDPFLRNKAEEVEKIDNEITKLANDMLETMYDAPGIGLAAMQIGVKRSLIVLDVDYRYDSEENCIKGANPLICINPKILWQSEERSTYKEGCLSIPEYYAEIERPKRIKISYIDIKGKEQILEADNLLATCLQHEIDHLNGVLFIDYLSKTRKDMVIKKFKKRQSQLAHAVL